MLWSSIFYLARYLVDVLVLQSVWFTSCAPHSGLWCPMNEVWCFLFLSAFCSLPYDLLYLVCPSRSSPNAQQRCIFSDTPSPFSLYFHTQDVSVIHSLHPWPDSQHHEVGQDKPICQQRSPASIFFQHIHGIRMAQFKPTLPWAHSIVPSKGHCRSSSCRVLWGTRQGNFAEWCCFWHSSCC